MQFQVPQFIDIEDRIIGPLTLKQFLYLAGAGGVLFILFMLLESFLFIFVAPPIAGVALALAFVKVNGRDFLFYLASLINFFTKPRLYLWQRIPRETMPQKETRVKKTTVIGEGEASRPIVEKKLQQIAWQLDVMKK